MSADNESPFERKVECPIRITAIVGYDAEEVQQRAKLLMDNFGWKYHSVAALMTLDATVTSIILWNTK